MNDASRSRRIAAYLYRRPRLQLRLLLAAPLAWLLLAYIGSLALMFANAFFRLDSFTGRVVFEPTLDNFATVIGTEVYRTITIRTVLLAAVVTLTCVVLAFPIAYYMARVASPRMRGWLIVATLMPLWVSYLVKVYAWRTMLIGNGAIDWALSPIGLGTPGFGEVALWLVFTYLWLPYMILPIYAGLERIPNSLISASEDLGARPLTTFRRVILPLVFPAVVAGSIFTFSLTLGDYIAPRLVSNTQFVGTAIFANITNDLPFAAALALIPIVVMIAYLAVARKLGAFEHI